MKNLFHFDQTSLRCIFLIPLFKMIQSTSDILGMQSLIFKNRSCLLLHLQKVAMETGFDCFAPNFSQSDARKSPINSLAFPSSLQFFAKSSLVHLVLGSLVHLAWLAPCRSKGTVHCVHKVTLSKILGNWSKGFNSLQARCKGTVHWSIEFMLVTVT